MYLFTCWQTLKKLLKISFLFIVSLTCISQNYSDETQAVDVRAFEIDNTPIKKISKKNFVIDTIRIKSKHFGDKVEIISKFENSRSNILTELYYDNGSLILIRFTENSEETIGKEHLAKINEYYYKNGVIFDQNFSIRLTSHAMCLGIPIEIGWYEEYSFNKNIDEEFFEKYSDILITKFR